jgi:hypothetical protein
MTIELPAGDLARVKSIEPDQSWPLLVQIVVAWKQPSGAIVHRTSTILADEYFGRGRFGAPIPAEALAMTVERLRREGPPPEPVKKKRAPAARKTPAQAKEKPVDLRQAYLDVRRGSEGLRKLTEPFEGKRWIGNKRVIWRESSDGRKLRVYMIDGEAEVCVELAGGETRTFS